MFELADRKPELWEFTYKGRKYGIPTIDSLPFATFMRIRKKMSESGNTSDIGELGFDEIMGLFEKYIPKVMESITLEQAKELFVAYVSIIFPDESSGLGLPVTYEYDSPLFNPDYRPGEGITCYNDMIGRVGYSIPGLRLEEYKDHWAESALEICNFEGENYIWYCISYKDEDDNKVYYSSIVKEHEDSEDEVVYSQKVEGSFVCCNIQEFAKIMQNKDAKRPSREYFENLDKESSLEEIVKEIGNYGLAGSGIIYHVWKLDDGSEARVTFDSQERIVRIYIHDKENSELIYDRYE